MRVKIRQETYHGSIGTRKATRYAPTKEKLPLSFRIRVNVRLGLGLGLGLRSGVETWLRFKVRVRADFLPTGTPSLHGTQSTFRYSSS